MSRKSGAIHTFLLEATGFGDLVASTHTSKRKGEKRTKYYLAPILSPYFRIPAVHTKEPEYVKIAQVQSWLTGSPVVSPVPTFSAPEQSSLWPELDGD